MYTLVAWLCRAAVGIGNRIWGNETVMTFLKTGIYNYWVPLGGVIHYEVPLQLSSSGPAATLMYHVAPSTSIKAV